MRIRFCALAILVAAVATAVLATVAAGHGHPVSQPFVIDKPKTFAGTMTDQMGADLAEDRLKLLDERNRAVKVSVTTPEGRYDLGILQPGRYRVRLKNKGERGRVDWVWCAPVVECTESTCHLLPLKACQPLD